MLLLALAALGAAPAADRVVARGDPAARLPSGALAGEYWDLVARFESGHVLLATVTLANTALGGRTAVAVGQLTEPDGTAHPFSRVEIGDGYRIAADGRRLELGSIVLDQSQATRRFEVDKNELGIEVAIDPMGTPAWPEDAAPGCPLDVLEVAGPASGRFRAADREPVPLRGLAALTHRWMPDLEVACLQRGVELFAMDGELGLYFREALGPEGEARRWLLVQRGGRTLHRGPADADLHWTEDAGGYPELAALRVAAPGVEARAETGAAIGSFEPLDRLPAPLRALLALRTRPRVVWSAPQATVVLEEPSGAGAAAPAERVRRRAPALVKLSYTNPLPPPRAARASGRGR